MTALDHRRPQPSERPPFKKNVLIVEEHASVLAEWWQRKFSGRTLVYFDAHLDLQFVNEERIDRLKQSSSFQAFRSLQRPHHLLPERGFSYGIEDFLYPAHSLGLIDRLIWVAPPHVETGFSTAALNQLQQMESVHVKDLTSFKKERGGWIQGSLLGLDLAICTYQQLHQISLPVDALLDFDVDYFITVPGDVAWVNPRTIFESLIQLPIEPELITVSRSVNSGFTPLCYRFLGDFLAALWQQRQDDAAHYERLFNLAQQSRLSDAESAAIGLIRESGWHPDCAATCYLLGKCLPDSQLAERYQLLAGNLCEAYRPSLLRYLCGVLNRETVFRPSSLSDLEPRLCESARDSLEEAQVQVALGMIHCRLGQVEEALSCLEKSECCLGRHPELSLEIAKHILHSEPDHAITLLKPALLADKSRVAAHALLSVCYWHCGEIRNSIEHLETAHEMAPAWDQVLLLLYSAYQQLGDPVRAEKYRQAFQACQSEIGMLVKRLTSEEGEVARESW